jgi:para-nitrobenzyl esterase
MGGTTVSTRSGTLHGTETSTARIFLDVPYAAPPVGALRFAPPEPHAPWTGDRDASRHGPNAPQPARDHLGSLALSPFFGDGWSKGDDYLTLSIWAPKGIQEPAPVVVFLHGGAFIAGSTHGPVYDGSAFARDGVIYVGVNYRLGVPGFLHVPDAPDNRGRLDVIAALKWLADNIAEFGGDPDNVTLMGQSAGAILVASIVSAADALGLFHRAIIQSGSGTAAFTPDQGDRVAEAIGRILDAVPTASSLAPFSDESLVRAVSQLPALNLLTETDHDPLGGITPFAPVQPEQPADEIVRGNGPQVDLLIGSNADESSLYVAPLGSLAGTTEAEVRSAAARFRGDPDRLVEAYRRSRPDATEPELLVAILSDGMFGTGTRRFADAHAELGSGGTWVYEFDWRSNALAGELGSAHLVELPFVFEQLDVQDLTGPNSLLGTEQAPQTLAARMHQAWVQFAKNGDPGWTRYRPQQRVVQRIGSTWRTAIDWRSDEFRAWRT